MVAGLKEQVMPAGRDAGAQASWTAVMSAPEVGVMVTVAVPLPFAESASDEGLIDTVNPPVFVSNMAVEAEPV
jgi:hypothetical protein